jgi:hypothetical protein
MSRLDEALPQFDARERHERRVPAPPELAVATALGVPAAPDAIARIRRRRLAAAERALR